MHNKNSRSFWLKSLVAGAAMLAAATSAHAVPAGPAEPTQWPVSSYTLSQDGANNGWYNDNGNDLTDGAYGMTVGGGYAAWAPYVLWDGHSPTITFDLGEVRAVGSITGHFLTYPSAAVYLPLTATVRFSDDGVLYGAGIVRGLWDATPLVNDTPVTLSLLASPGQGRFVSVTLQSPGRWIALSEVTLQAPVPEPQTWALLVAGLGLVTTLRARRRRGG